MTLWRKVEPACFLSNARNEVGDRCSRCTCRAALHYTHVHVQEAKKRRLVSFWVRSSSCRVRARSKDESSSFVEQSSNVKSIDAYVRLHVQNAVELLDLWRICRGQGLEGPYSELANWRSDMVSSAAHGAAKACLVNAIPQSSLQSSLHQPSCLCPGPSTIKASNLTGRWSSAMSPLQPSSAGQGIQGKPKKQVRTTEGPPALLQFMMRFWPQA